MGIKLLLAKPADDKEGAKVFVQLFSDTDLVSRHTLKLHQDDRGYWHPELDISVNLCPNKDIQNMRCELAARLEITAKLLRSEEAGQIKIMTDMVSK